MKMTNTTNTHFGLKNQQPDSIMRILAVMGCVALSIVMSPLMANAQSDSDAENFMRTVLIDANAAMLETDREQQFAVIDRLVDQHVDMRRTGRFTLGQYARQMTDEQAAQYYPLFRQYATNIYQGILSEYNGRQLEVTGSVAGSSRNIVVNSRVVNARPGSQFANTNFQWRLYKSDGGYKVVDAGANNIWLAIEQRSQFTAVIANNGGGTRGIDALIALMRERVGEM